MTVARVTLWDEINRKEQETDHIYNIEEMDLFSDNPPNEYFKQFYDDYMSYKTRSLMIENEIVKDITKKLTKSKILY